MSLQIHGMEDVRRVLDTLLPDEADKLKRQASGDMARDIAKAAKENMPVLTGRLKKGTRGQQERAKDGPDATVRSEAFYWHMLERGDGPDGVEHAFFMRAKQTVLSNFDSRVAAHFKRRLAALMRRGL